MFLQLDDRMESFMLSETLKYLYLLFDHNTSSRSTPSPNSNKVFTTEGHLLSLSHNLQKKPSTMRRQAHKGENLQCPVYQSPTLGGPSGKGIVVGIERTSEYEYARMLVFGQGIEGRVFENKERVGWSEGGFCKLQDVPKFVSSSTSLPHRSYFLFRYIMLSDLRASYSQLTLSDV